MLSEIGVRRGLWSSGVPAVVLARGGENTTFAVADYVVRFNEDHDAAAREAGLLYALAAETTVATPVPLVHDAGRGLLVYRRLPGEPLILRPHRRAPDIVAALAGVLGTLRRLPVAQDLPVDDYSNEAWHDDALENFRAAQSQLDPARAAAVTAFLSEPPPPTRERFVPQHNDLGAEHILVDRAGAVTGIIDWTDAARADSVRDLGLIYRDLGSDIAFRLAETLDGSPGDEERERIRFHGRCKWLEDFRFAVEDPETRAPYMASCLRTFDRTFRESA